MIDCLPLLSLQLSKAFGSLVNLIRVLLRISLLNRWKFVSSVSIEADADESNLIEGIILVDMIGSHDESHEFSLERNIDLLEFSC